MIKAKLLNSEAALNDYFYIGAVEFVPGEDVKVAIQIFDVQRDIRYIPPSAAELTLTFTDSEGDPIEKTAGLIDVDDRSMWYVELSQAESEVLAGQNIEITLDVNGDGTEIKKTLIANGIVRINLSGDC